MQQQYKKVIQIELNELSYPIVEQLIAKGKMPNFSKINREWSFLQTTSETEYNNIEPWIQWVTAHTGKTYPEHQIFRLSDVHKLQHKQIWEELSENGIESGIVGSMNVTRRNTKGGLFFSDSWSQNNEAHPAKLRSLWELISNRVQGHATSSISINDIRNGLLACVQYRLPINIYFKMAAQIVKQKLSPLTKWKLAAVFDLFLTELFISVLKTTNFGYYTLFLNSVAHYQHHYWRNFDISPFDKSIRYDDIAPEHDPITYGYEMYDKILGRILKIAEKKDTLIIIASALSQIPYTAKEKQGGMNYYRLNNHQEFANSIGLDSEYEVFPLMSRDWQLKYTNEVSHQKALNILKGLKINNEPLFAVQENTEGYLFIETIYSKVIGNDDYIINAKNEQIANFKNVFTNIAIKSGHHTGVGNLWLSDKALGKIDKQQISLTELYDMTLRSLGVFKESVEKQQISS